LVEKGIKKHYLKFDAFTIPLPKVFILLLIMFLPN